MTINEALTAIDNLKPNTADVSDKIKWLATLDGQIQNEIINKHIHDESEDVDREYTADTDRNTVLAVSFPYDVIYTMWLSAQIDFINGETNRYNNSMAMFNNYYREFTNWYNREHMPIGETDFKYFRGDNK